MALLDQLLGTGTDASGNSGIGVNVNVTIAQASLVSLFIVGVGLIVVGVLGGVILSVIKRKSA
jgi:hypothetical protein